MNPLRRIHPDRFTDNAKDFPMTDLPTDERHDYANTTLTGLAMLEAYNKRDSKTVSELLLSSTGGETISGLLNAMSLINQGFANERNIGTDDAISLFRDTIIGHLSQGVLAS